MSSLLLRERGLKSLLDTVPAVGAWSLLLRERGLKFVMLEDAYAPYCVAPLAGARIEIIYCSGSQTVY